MANPFRKPEPVRHDVDGHAVLIRPLTAGEMFSVMHLEQSNPAMGWKANFMMISLGVLDTQGQRMFATTEDAEALDYEMALKLRNLCFEANGLGQTESKKN